MHYRLATLLAIGVCAPTSAGHNSLSAVAEWARRCSPQELQRLSYPFNSLTGHYRVPDEGTLREAYTEVTPSRLTPPAIRMCGRPDRPGSTRLTPDGLPEREQRHHCQRPPSKPRRTAIAVDGKCLRSARRPDGSQVFVTLRGIP